MDSSRISRRFVDRLFAAGAPHIIKPFGMEALEMARIETGFIQAGRGFYSGRRDYSAGTLAVSL